MSDWGRAGPGEIRHRPVLRACHDPFARRRRQACATAGVRRADGHPRPDDSTVYEPGKGSERVQPRACVATRASTLRPGVRPPGSQGGNGSLRCERPRLDVRRYIHYIDPCALVSLQTVKPYNLALLHVRRPGRRPGPVAPVSGSNPRHGGPRAHRDPRPPTQRIGARTGSTRENRLCRAPSATACLSTPSGAVRTRGSRKGSITGSGVCCRTVPSKYAVSGILVRPLARFANRCHALGTAPRWRRGTPRGRVNP